jgi:hypothetical protein
VVCFAVVYQFGGGVEEGVATVAVGECLLEAAVGAAVAEKGLCFHCLMGFCGLIDFLGGGGFVSAPVA